MVWRLMALSWMSSQTWPLRCGGRLFDRLFLTGAGEPENGRPWVCDASDVRHIRRLEKAGEFDEAKRYFEAMNANRARKKAQKAKKYRMEDLKEVINIIAETAA